MRPSLILIKIKNEVIYKKIYKFIKKFKNLLYKLRFTFIYKLLKKIS